MVSAANPTSAKGCERRLRPDLPGNEVAMKILRRLRGVLGMAVTWGVAFGLIGVVGGVLLALGIGTGVIPAPAGGSRIIILSGLGVVARWAAIGVCSGLAFAITLMLAEHRESLTTLSSRRFARWGMLGGALGSAAVAAAFVAIALPTTFVATAGWSLAGPLVGVPVVGGALGRVMALKSLRAARGEGRRLPAERA
jgi:hypothetical protein